MGHGAKDGALWHSTYNRSRRWTGSNNHNSLGAVFEKIQTIQKKIEKFRKRYQNFEKRSRIKKVI